MSEKLSEKIPLESQFNIKKTGGAAQAIDSELQKYYDFSKPLLYAQINEFKPTIIIFCGTYKFFKNDLNLGKLESFGSCEAIIKQGRIYISAYHPMYTIKEEDYFNDIINAVRHKDWLL